MSLISSPFIVSIHCSKCNPPKRQKYNPEPNFSGYLDRISFVRAKAGWSHTSTEFWPGFKKATVWLIISMQWHWVDSEWSDFGTIRKQHLFLLMKPLAYCQNDVWTRILCYQYLLFFATTIDLSVFQKLWIALYKGTWNIYCTTWSV